MKAFWINVAAALFVSALFGSAPANWARKRINAKVAADERAAAAQVRIAEALDRIYPPKKPAPIAAFTSSANWICTE